MFLHDTKARVARVDPTAGAANYSPPPGGLGVRESGDRSPRRELTSGVALVKVPTSASRDVPFS